MIWSWPGRVLQDLRSPALCELVDIAPTLMQAAGLEVPRSMQGSSLWPLLTGAADPAHHKSHVVCEFNDALGSAANAAPSHGSMYFDGRFKHNVYHGTGLGELFDLENDPGEFDNLWDDPAQRERRCALLAAHFDAMMATSDAGAERVAMY